MVIEQRAEIGEAEVRKGGGGWRREAASRERLEVARQRLKWSLRFGGCGGEREARELSS